MGKTGVQPSKVYLRSAALLTIAFFLMVLVSCGGSSNSVPPDTGDLRLSSSSLTFSHTIHDTALPATQPIDVTSASGSSIDYSATIDVTGTNWLSVQPSNGSTPGQLAVTVLPTNLGAGTYTGHVIVVGPNTRATATVTFKVESTTAAILDVTVPTATVPSGQQNPCQGVANCMLFTAVQGGEDPMPQLFSVKNDNTNSDPPEMQFVLSTATNPASSWLTTGQNADTSCSGAWVSGTSATGCPTSGVATASVSVRPHVGSLAAGTYTGTVTVTSEGAVHSPATVNVIFVVTP